MDSLPAISAVATLTLLVALLGWLQWPVWTYIVTVPVSLIVTCIVFLLVWDWVTD